MIQWRSVMLRRNGFYFSVVTMLETVSLDLRQLTDPLFIPQMIHEWNVTDKGNHKSHMDCPRRKPGPSR
jgi:hypothetical protein